MRNILATRDEIFDFFEISVYDAAISEMAEEMGYKDVKDCDNTDLGIIAEKMGYKNIDTDIQEIIVKDIFFGEDQAREIIEGQLEEDHLESLDCDDFRDCDIDDLVYLIENYIYTDKEIGVL